MAKHAAKLRKQSIQIYEGASKVLKAYEFQSAEEKVKLTNQNYAEARRLKDLSKDYAKKAIKKYLAYINAKNFITHQEITLPKTDKIVKEICNTGIILFNKLKQ